MNERVEHRMDSPERKHYTVEGKSVVDIKPVLLYCGTLLKAKDWRDSEHHHRFLEIIYVLDGTGDIDVEDTRYAVSGGDIVVYDAFKPHFEHSSVESPLEVRFIAFDSVQLKNLPINCILPPDAKCVFQAGKFGKTLMSLFDIINEEIWSKDEFYIEVAKNAARTLLMIVLRVIRQTQSNVVFLNKDNILNGVLPYIEKNMLNDISLEDIAAQCFVSKFYLSHLFSESMGMSIGQYIRNKKIELAKTYLAQENMSIEGVAEKCGFHELNYFGRTFKKVTNQTPTQYRNSLKTKEMKSFE